MEQGSNTMKQGRMVAYHEAREEYMVAYHDIPWNKGGVVAYHEAGGST